MFLCCFCYCCICLGLAYTCCLCVSLFVGDCGLRLGGCWCLGLFVVYLLWIFACCSCYFLVWLCDVGVMVLAAYFGLLLFVLLVCDLVVLCCWFLWLLLWLFCNLILLVCLRSFCGIDCGVVVV